MGIWLAIYEAVNTLFSPDISPSLSAYLNVSNFIVAAVIVLLIVDSNYRNFYYKQNTKAIRRYYDGRLRSTDTHEKVRANKGNAVEKVADYWLILMPDTCAEINDLIEIHGVQVKIIQMIPRYSLRGELDHKEALCAMWNEVEE